VNTDYRAFTSVLSRSATAIVCLAMAVLAYFWFIQPRVAAYVLARNDVRTQQARVATLQDALTRGARIPPATDAAFVADFARRMSADDKVSEILASIARSLGSGDADTRVRGLLIEAGERLPVAVQRRYRAARRAAGPRRRGPCHPGRRSAGAAASRSLAVHAGHRQFRIGLRGGRVLPLGTS
jgi:hypothetical protein